MNLSVSNAEIPTERNASDSRVHSSPVELDMKKYAPLLERAGVPPQSHERYLRELAGAVESILDSYFEDLKGSAYKP